MEETKQVKSSEENIIIKSVYDIGIILLLFIVINILSATVFQFLNIAISFVNLTISSILTIGVYMLLRKNVLYKKRYNLIANILISCLIIIVCTFICSNIFDFTYDGNYYHKPAIGMLKQGWNPLKESSYEFNLKNNPEMCNKDISLWIDHYPKATWNFGAIIYSITNNIESGKVLTLLVEVSLAFFMLSYIYLKKFKLWKSILLMLITVLNPIVCSQLFSYYVDGIMGVMLYIVILFLIILSDNEFNYITKFEKWLVLGMSIILCMNIKFTGILFAGIFSLIFYIYWLIKSYIKKEFKNRFINITICFAIIAFITIVIVGYSSYIKNMIDHKNPLYPLMGEGKVDIVTKLQPVSFSEKNRFVKLFESIFSESNNITYSSNLEPKYKLPFTFNKDEISISFIPDLRIGGFGIFYSGMFIVSSTVLIYLIIKNRKRFNSTLKYTMLILLGIVIITLLIEESWWARYSPQLYLIPILALINIFSIDIKSTKLEKIFTTSLGIFIFTIAMFNALVFLKWRVNDFLISRKVKLELLNFESVNHSKKVNIGIIDDSLIGELYNLKDYNIEYNLLKEKDINMKKELYKGLIKY